MWQITYTVISSPNADGSSGITSLSSHFSRTRAFSSRSSLPNRLKECFLPSLPLFTSHLLCGRTYRADALLCMPWDTSSQTLLWTRAGFLLCQWSSFGSQCCEVTWTHLFCETLQTQHVLFSFPALCNTPVQLLGPAMLFAGLDANKSVLQAPL